MLVFGIEKLTQAGKSFSNRQFVEEGDDCKILTFTKKKSAKALIKKNVDADITGKTKQTVATFSLIKTDSNFYDPKNKRNGKAMDETPMEVLDEDGAYLYRDTRQLVFHNTRMGEVYDSYLMATHYTLNYTYEIEVYNDTTYIVRCFDSCPCPKRGTSMWHEKVFNIHKLKIVSSVITEAMRQREEM